MGRREHERLPSSLTPTNTLSMSLFFNVGKSDMKGVCGGEAWMVVFHGYAHSHLKDGL